MLIVQPHNVWYAGPPQASRVEAKGIQRNWTRRRGGPGCRSQGIPEGVMNAISEDRYWTWRLSPLFFFFCITCVSVFSFLINRINCWISWWVHLSLCVFQSIRLKSVVLDPDTKGDPPIPVQVHPSLVGLYLYWFVSLLCAFSLIDPWCGYWLCWVSTLWMDLRFTHHVFISRLEQNLWMNVYYVLLFQVRILKKHQAEGVSFMYDSAFESLER